MRTLPGLLSGLALCGAAGLATSTDAADAAVKERYIPVELWAGAEWDGARELKMPQVNATYHHSRTYQIKGPIEYKHPATGKTFSVYERTNPQRSGVKYQLFTINEKQTGLGRLFDGRPGRDTRTSSGGLKFPLGVWKEGETRSYVYTVYDTRGSQSTNSRIESITIRQIDFSFQGMAHCLEFDWNVTDAAARTTYDRQTYVYCPGKSMVSQIQH